MTQQVQEQEVIDAVGGTDPSPVPSARELFGSLTSLLSQGSVVGHEAKTLAEELVRIGLGRSEVAPQRGDGRFRDPAWQENAVFHRLEQAYLATCQASDNLVDTLEEKDWSHAQKARFLMGIVTSTASPTNLIIANPAAMKRARDTRGASLAKGFTNWVSDVRGHGGMPSMATPGALKVGEDLALTPGGVVSRDPVAEIIQYTPTTEQVYARPTLIVPPPIGRFYFLDLAPGRSFAEYTVSRGIQTFMLSWRNPTKDQADWSIDTYATRILSAIDEVREITGSKDVNVIGFCAGGILNTVVLNHLAAIGDKRVHAASYAVTLLDWSGDNPISAFQAAPVISLAKWNSRRNGVIDAQTMGSAFTWMRPNDLVWNYWVNNYLLGQDPPVFDILSWNADGTNLPAKLHAQFLDIFADNNMVEPGSLTYLGTPLDVSTIKVPTFVMGALNDHLTPWRGTYRTTEMTSGPSTYVLSNAGHIAALVNPPGNPKASYFVGGRGGAVDADSWREKATKKTGSWWEAWADWTIKRSRTQIAAPKTLGSQKQPVLTKAPGLYVRDQLPS
ncbi:MAG: poly[(R)-3-hydroxyalkanoate] polymerase subunit PhaC [Actinomycetota bacterium]|nr:poly[(R)-3-hydroxyalkanoate] polymerase subunit PhaC [Actinomycetota bacterium]